MLHRYTSRALAALACLALFAPALASAEPVQVPLQGLLTDSDGRAVDGNISIGFTIYATPDATGEPLWTGAQVVPLAGGLFTVMLGSETELDSEIFHANPSASVTLRVEGDEESAPIPLGHLPLAAHAASASSADDAQTLQGLTPDDLRAVSAADVTYEDADSRLEASDTQSAIARLLERVEALEADRDALSERVGVLEGQRTAMEGRIVSLETSNTQLSMKLTTLETEGSERADALATLGSTVMTLGTRVSGVESSSSSLSSDVSNLGARVSSVEGSVSTLQSSFNAVQAQVTGFNGTLQSLADDVDAVETNTAAYGTRLGALETKTASMSAQTIGGYDAVVFDSVNLHVRSGSGATIGGAVPGTNGLGNLVIGYDESRTTGSDKSGSHNLVLGRENNYTSFGGIVGGYRNSTTGQYSSIFTGTNNEATSTYSVVLTGSSNDSTSTSSVVLSGSSNEATGADAVVVSGSSNDATGSDAVIVSGSLNSATGTTAVVVGGYNNDSDGWRSVAVGGSSNRAGDTSGDNYPVVVGGSSNFADGSNVTVSGGSGETETAASYWRGGTLRSQ